MELELAKKLEDMDFRELAEVLRKLMIEDRQAFEALKEIVDDTI